jgi:hypothetical protein
MGGEGSERMKNKRYILLFAGAVVWMVSVWIPFSLSHSSALFLTAIYCTVTACMLPVFIAVEIGNRRRKVEEQKTEERSRKIALAFQRAETDAQSRLDAQRYAEANHRWMLEKARKFETSSRYKEAARMYDELEMQEKAGICRRMTKTSA